MIIGSLLLPLMDAAAKVMGETLASSLIVLSRFSFQSLFLLPLVWSTLYIPKGLELRFHLYRAVSLGSATLCFFTAIQVMPLADALAIFFVMPLWVTLLSPWFLGESIGWHRIIAVLIGLVGAVIIIQPGQSVFGFYAVLPLGTALFFSFYLIFTRKLARSEAGGDVSPLAMQFYSGLFGAIYMLIVILVMQPLDLAWFKLQWPELWQWRQLVLVGLLAAIGHLFMTSAFRHADASLLAPFQYIELVSAALIGWIMFGDVPAVTTWIGSSILVASGVYVFHREQIARKATP